MSSSPPVNQEAASKAARQSGQRTPPKALFCLSEWAFSQIYGESEIRAIEGLADLQWPRLTPRTLSEHPGMLEEAEVIFSGWIAPRLDAEFLKAAPNLKLFLYGAGATNNIVTPELRESGVMLSSAIGVNAIPVAEFTIAQIVLGLKHAWRYAYDLKRDKALASCGTGHRPSPPGLFETTVGLISLGHIGREVARRLAAFDVAVIAYDPHFKGDSVEGVPVEMCGLEEVFERADVISLHTPLKDETRHMLGREHFKRMKQGGTFINTARGQLIREDELIQVLRERPDITALLDLTYHEPTPPDSPLLELPNAFVTPHIAGSTGHECTRMGRAMVAELKRYLEGKPLKHRVV